MNKRWNDRKPTSLELVINYPALGLLRGRATNISFDGMFIETAAISLCNYANIEVTLALADHVDAPIQFQAVIIHSSNNGIGIMFKDHEDSLGLEHVHQLIAKPNNFYQQAS